MRFTASLLDNQYCPYKFRLSPINEPLRGNSFFASLTYDLLTEDKERNILIVSENDLVRDSLNHKQGKAFQAFKQKIEKETGGNIARLKGSVIGYFEHLNAGQAVAIYRFGPVPVFQLSEPVQLPGSSDKPARTVRIGVIPRLPRKINKNPEAVLPLLLKTYGYRFDRLMDKYFDDVAVKFRAIRIEENLLNSFQPAWRSQVTLSESVGTKLAEIDKALHMPFNSKARQEAAFILDADEKNTLIDTLFGHIFAQYLLNQYYQRVGKTDRCAYYENKWQTTANEWRNTLGADWSGIPNWLQTAFDLTRSSTASSGFDALLANLNGQGWQAEFVAFARYLAETKPVIYTEADIPRFIQGLLVSLKAEEKRLIGRCLRIAGNKMSKTQLIGQLRCEYEELAETNGGWVGSWSKLKAEQKIIENAIEQLYLIAVGFSDERREELAGSLFEEINNTLKNIYDITAQPEQKACLWACIRTWAATVVLHRRFTEFDDSANAIIAALKNLRIAEETLAKRIAVGTVPFDEEQINEAVDHLIMSFSGCLNLPGNQAPIPNANELADCVVRAYENCETARTAHAMKLIQRWRDLSLSSRKGVHSPEIEKLFARAYPKIEKHTVHLNGEATPLLIKQNMKGRLHFTANLQNVITKLCPALDLDGIQRVESRVLVELMGYQY